MCVCVCEREREREREFVLVSNAMVALHRFSAACRQTGYEPAVTILNRSRACRNLTLPQDYAFEFGVRGYPAALLACLFATSASGLGLRVSGFRV